MRNFIPALILLFNASAALAQSQPVDAGAPTSSQQVVVEAVNLAPPQPQRAPMAVITAQAAPAVATGIGPSSNMPQPGDYGYSAWSDLRQLNF